MENDEVIIYPYRFYNNVSVNSWTSQISITTSAIVDSNTVLSGYRAILAKSYGAQTPIYIDYSNAQILLTTCKINELTSLNLPSGDICSIRAIRFNGAGMISSYINVTASNATQYIYKMYRLRR